jgi:large subunit ribosomal protein L4
MELTIRALSGEAGSTLEVSDAVFAQPFREALVHQVVTSYLAGGRLGTRAQKSRAEVTGGGAKPWRQKGTGRARAGTSRSPLWRSGGMAFPARPQSHAQKVNRKMYRGALRSILAELARQERLVVVADFTMDVPKTKALVGRLRELEIEGGLIVTADDDLNLTLAGRNLPSVEVCSVAAVSPVNLVSHDKVLITVAALKQLEERLS